MNNASKRRHEIAERDGWYCYYCDKHLDDRTATIDHAKSIMDGGSDYLDNLVLACVSCNNKKGSDSLPQEEIRRIEERTSEHWRAALSGASNRKLRKMRRRRLSGRRLRNERNRAIYMVERFGYGTWESKIRDGYAWDTKVVAHIERVYGRELSC